MPRRNLDPNPAAANNLTGISANTSAAAVTPTRVTTGLAAPWVRTTAARATAPSSPGTYLDLRRAAHNPGAVLDGLPCSGVIQWSTNATLASNVFLVALDSAGSGLLGFEQVAVAATAGAVNTSNLNIAALPSGTRQVAIWVRINSPATGNTVTTGLCRLELVNDPNLVLADGSDTSSGWAFDGAAGSSTSTRARDDDGHEWWALLAGQL